MESQQHRVAFTRELFCSGIPRKFLLKHKIKGCAECDNFRARNEKANYSLTQQEQKNKKLHCRIRSINHMNEKRKLPPIKLIISYTDNVTSDDSIQNSPTIEGTNDETTKETESPVTSNFNQAEDLSQTPVTQRATLQYVTPATRNRHFARSKRPLADQFLMYNDEGSESAFSTPDAHCRSEIIAVKRMKVLDESAKLKNHNTKLMKEIAEISSVNARLKAEITNWKIRTKGLIAELDQLRGEQKSEVEQLKKQVKKANFGVRKKDGLISTLIKECKKALPAQRELVVGRLSTCVRTLLKILLHQKWETTQAKHLLDAIFTGGIFNGSLWKSELLARCRKEVNQRIFKPWLIQKAIDVGHAGSLNYGGLELLNKIDPLPKRSRRCLPSSTSVRRCARELEDYAKSLLPYEHSLTTYGPLYYFVFEPLVRHLAKSFSLDQYAKEGSNAPPPQIAGTVDGAKLTNKLHHLLGGFKVLDQRAMDPNSNLPLFLDGKFQSRDNCFPAIILLARDNKEIYQTVFKRFFDFLGQLRDTGLPESAYGEALPYWNIARTEDLSSLWKTFGVGGGSGHTLLFCVWCTLANDRRGIAFTGEHRCNRCKTREINRCFCLSVEDTDHLKKEEDKIIEELSFYLAFHYEKFDLIASQSKLFSDPAHAGKEDELNHIDFCTEGKSPAIQRKFRRFLIQELVLRYPSRAADYATMSVDQLRFTLRIEAEMESKVSRLRVALVRKEKQQEEVRSIILEQAVPCILHMENRVNERVLYALFCRLIYRYGDSPASIAKRDALMDKISNIMRTRVLGTLSHPSQWDFPWDEQKKHF